MEQTTESLAASLGMKPQSIRARVCRTGHYFGLRPKKLPNGRLLWPVDAIARLTAGLPVADTPDLSAR